MSTRRKRGNTKKRERERERERAMWTKPMCNYTWAFSSKNDTQFLPSIFSLFWRKNFLVCPKRKDLSPAIYFSTQPNIL